MSDDLKTTICTLTQDVFSAHHTLRRGTLVRCGEVRPETRWRDGDPMQPCLAAVRDITEPTSGATILCVDTERMVLGAAPELRTPSRTTSVKWSDR